MHHTWCYRSVYVRVGYGSLRKKKRRRKKELVPTSDGEPWELVSESGHNCRVCVCTDSDSEPRDANGRCVIIGGLNLRVRRVAPPPPPRRHIPHVMTLFDRKVDLAWFTDSTPLYVMCREWMRNNPQRRRSRSASVEQVSDSICQSNQNTSLIGIPSCVSSVKFHTIFSLVMYL